MLKSVEYLRFLKKPTILIKDYKQTNNNNKKKCESIYKSKNKIHLKQNKTKQNKKKRHESFQKIAIRDPPKYLKINILNHF